MKKVLSFVLVFFLISCQAVVDEQVIDVVESKPVLVVTYIDGLEESLESFLNQPFVIVKSMDDIEWSDYERVLVLYEDSLRRVFPPFMFNGPRLEYSQIVTFTHLEGVEVTMVYLDGVTDYQEMFGLLNLSIYQIREPLVVYHLYPLEGVYGHVESTHLNREKLIEYLPEGAELAPSGNDLRWFIMGEEFYFFLENVIPPYLMPYADQIRQLENEVAIIVNERGQRLTIGRSIDQFAPEYYESFLITLSEGIESSVILIPQPPVGVSFPQARVASPEVCYTNELNSSRLGPYRSSTTVSHQLPKDRVTSIGKPVGLVIMIGFDEFSPVVSDDYYRSLIQKANDSADAFYDEMSQGLLNFEWIYYPDVVYVPFFLDPSINGGTPGFMDLINDHIYKVLDQVEKDTDLSNIDLISFFWPLGLPNYVPDGVAELRSERMDTKRGNIYNYILQRVTEDQTRLAYVLTHELAHTLGLRDTYIFPWIPEYIGKPPTYKYGYWDLMAANNELNAWHRWILSWMPDEQVYCLPNGTNKDFEVFLEPLNESDADIRQIVISLSSTEAISIELRGPGEFCERGCDQNILVTHIDTLAVHAPLLIIRPERSFRPDHSDSLLLKGESVQFRNVTITHKDRFALGSIVSISFDE
jgi:hypothetical protein